MIILNHIQFNFTSIGKKEMSLLVQNINKTNKSELLYLKIRIRLFMIIVFIWLMDSSSMEGKIVNIKLDF